MGGLPGVHAAGLGTRSRICLSIGSPSVCGVAPNASRFWRPGVFTIEGRRVLLHIMTGSKEDAETLTAFFEDMKSRRRPLHPGLPIRRPLSLAKELHNRNEAS